MYKNNPCFILGVFLGFPECCINDFMGRNRLKIFKEKRKLFGTGFVPCEVCNSKTEDELLRVIDKNRISKFPFPSESVSMEDDCHDIMLSSIFTLEQKESFSRTIEQKVRVASTLPKKIYFSIGKAPHFFKFCISIDKESKSFRMPIRNLK